MAPWRGDWGCHPGAGPIPPPPVDRRFLPWVQGWQARACSAGHGGRYGYTTTMINISQNSQIQIQARSRYRNSIQIQASYYKYLPDMFRCIYDWRQNNVCPHFFQLGDKIIFGISPCSLRRKYRGSCRWKIQSSLEGGKRSCWISWRTLHVLPY